MKFHPRSSQWKNDLRKFEVISGKIPRMLKNQVSLYFTPQWFIKIKVALKRTSFGLSVLLVSVLEVKFQ
jgi:hypothetical protein